jgi:Ca2+-binding RTX toxin-like protein
MDGGEDVDQAGYSTASQGVTVDLTTGIASGAGEDTLANFERIGGSGYDDILIGNELDNVITGKTGNDVMVGMAGNDKILTGFGDDVFDGGEGEFDQLDARAATAGLAVNLGANTISGEGNDMITGIEEVAGSLYDDSITGDAGPNTLRGRAGNDTISGAAGDDWIVGRTGNDTLDGGAGNDTIEDLEGTDIVNGGAGDDLLLPWRTAENDSFTGGDGVDTIDFSTHNAGIQIDMESGAIYASGPGEVATVEGVLGTLFVDTIRGNAADNRFEGRRGNDQLVGGGGNDWLKGGGGSDLIDGGSGFDDTVVLDDAVKPVTADLFAGFSTGLGNDTIVSIENIIGSIWPDVLRGDAGNNEISGGPGADSLEGFDGNDILNGDEGNDFADGGGDTDVCTAEREVNCE